MLPMKKSDGWLIISMAALCGGILLLSASPVQAAGAEEVLVANLHPVDAGRVSDRQIGMLRFTPGKGEKEVKIFVRIQDLPLGGQEPLEVESSHAIYRHGLQIRATGDCKDMTIGKSEAGLLPNVDVRNDGSADLSITAEGITMAELPGKTAVLYRGTDADKQKIIACGVIKKPS